MSASTATANGAFQNTANPATRWLMEAGLHELPVPEGQHANGTRVGIGGLQHAHSRTGGGGPTRHMVMLLLMVKARDYVIGAGRARWDFLSLGQIAMWTGRSKRHVRRVLRELESLGLVRTRFRKWSTSVYEVMMDNLERLAGRRKGAKLDERANADRVVSTHGGELPAMDDLFGGRAPGRLVTLPPAVSLAARTYAQVAAQVLGAQWVRQSGGTARKIDRLARDRGLGLSEWRDECRLARMALEEVPDGAAHQVRKDPVVMWRVNRWAKLITEAEEWRDATHGAATRIAAPGLVGVSVPVPPGTPSRPMPSADAAQAFDVAVDTFDTLHRDRIDHPTKHRPGDVAKSRRLIDLAGELDDVKVLGWQGAELALEVPLERQAALGPVLSAIAGLLGRPLRLA